MADITTEKTLPSTEFTPADYHDVEGAGGISRPAGWMYKSVGVGRYGSYYASPATQLVLGMPFST